MSFAESTVNISLISGEVVSIFRFGDVDANGAVNMADAVTDDAIGIIAETITVSGTVVPVTISGVGMIELGATIAAGARVSSGADGVAIAASAANNAITCGPLLQGGDAGDVVPILINFHQVSA